MYNPYILIPFAVWVIAQVLKFSLAAFRGNIDYRLMYTSGGMPSAHSAVVASMATTALLLDGSSSHIFGLTAIVAAIVMYDSFGVRRSSGDQAIAINKLFAAMTSQKFGPVGMIPVREMKGHKPLEVGLGALLGVVLAGIFNYDKLTNLVNFVTVVPVKKEIIVYAGLGLLTLILSIVTYYALRRLRPKSLLLKSVAKKTLLRLQGVGWLVLLLAFAEYEKAAYLAWRIWPLLGIVTGVALMTIMGYKSLTMVPSHLAEELEKERISKWLEPRNRKKKKKH